MGYKESYKRLLALAAKLPGPPGLPVVGNAMIFSNTPEEIFKKIVSLTKEYESPSRYWLGSNLAVVVSKPEDLQIVLNDAKTMGKSEIYGCFANYIGSGLITSSVDKWRKNRRSLIPMFDIRLLRDFMSVFNKHNKTLVDKLKPFINHNQFNIESHISSANLDMICDTTLGVDETVPEKVKSDFTEAIKKSYEQLLMRCYNVMLPSNVIFKLVEGLSFGASSSGRLSNEFYLFPNMIIEKKKDKYRHRKGQSNKGQSFLDILLEISDGGAKLSDDVITDEVIELILSGYGPVAMANCFCILMLAINQDIQENLYKEISGIYDKSGHDVTLEGLQQMTYTEMVIKETLRIYPVLPIFLRSVKEEIKLIKHELPVGCTIVIFPLATHLDQKIFPNPTKFNPENFTHERISQRHRYSYLPFGAGPRNCLGYTYAMFSVKTTLVHLMRNYKFSTDMKTEDIKLKMDLLLRSSNGFPVKITQRKG